MCASEWGEAGELARFRPGARLPAAIKTHARSRLRELLGCLRRIAFSFEHSSIHLAQVEGQFQPLARGAHQLLVTSLTSRFEGRAQRLYLVFLSLKSLYEIFFGHNNTTRLNFCYELRGRPNSSNFNPLNRGDPFSEPIIPNCQAGGNNKLRSHN